MEDFKSIKMNNNTRINENNRKSNTKITLEFSGNLTLVDNLNYLSKLHLDGYYFNFQNPNNQLSIFNSLGNFECLLADNNDVDWVEVVKNPIRDRSYEIYIPNVCLKLENLKGYNIQNVINFLSVNEFKEEVSKFITKTLMEDKVFLKRFLDNGQIRNLPCALLDDDEDFCRIFRENKELVEKFKKQFCVSLVIVRDFGDFEVFE